MAKRWIVAGLVWVGVASAQPVDPCEEARVAGAEIVAAQGALLHLLRVEKRHCRKAPKHVACPSFTAVRSALEAYVEIQKAVRAFRKGECSGVR